MDAVREQVLAFVSRNFYVAEPASLRDTTSFIDTGIIDSTGVLELVGFLETDLGIEVLDAEMTPENLDNIGAVVAFVARKRAS